MRTPLDEFAKLLENPSHDLSVDVYNGNKKRRGKPVKNHKSKYTLNQVGSKLDQVSTRLDQVADVLFLLINRFDYVVKANNLKDLPKSKNTKK